MSLIIKYKNIPDVVYADAASMEKYLRHEAERWSAFLQSFDSVPGVGREVVKGSMAEVFDNLIRCVKDSEKFHAEVQRLEQGRRIPPPADSLYGQLVLGLFGKMRTGSARNVFLWFAESNGGERSHNSHTIAAGRSLVDAAYVSEALPFQRVTAQKLSAISRKAEDHVAALQGEVDRSREITEAQAQDVSKEIDMHRQHFEEFAKLVATQDEQRGADYDAWCATIDRDVAARFEKGEARLEAIARLNSEKQNAHQKEFEQLKELFYTQLRLRAPVKLWETRAAQHGAAAKRAHVRFFGAIIIAMVVALSVPLYWGDYIADSFATQICGADTHTGCDPVFSAKGPLSIASVLLITSLLLWVTRLQYRVYLSERHLGLDAREKQAFAETFMAMREGDGVSAESEAIVLASLFRPTQDGIIKDDETNVDFSAAAVIAKQFGKSG